MLAGKYDREEVIEGYDEEDANIGADYLKELLEEKTRISLIKSKDYGNNYKQHADKVISVLKKTSKKIYQRVANNRQLVKKETQDKESDSKHYEKLRFEEQEPQKTPNNTIYSKTQHQPQQKNVFLTDLLDKMPTNRQTPVAKSPIETTPRGHIRSRSTASPSNQHLQRRKNIQQLAPVLKNKHFNTLHKQSSNVLLRKMDAFDKSFKNYKLVMGKQIEQLEDLYESELKKMREDPLDSLRITFQNKGHFGSFMNKPIKMDLSRKKLANVLA